MVAADEQTASVHGQPLDLSYLRQIPTASCIPADFFTPRASVLSGPFKNVEVAPNVLAVVPLICLSIHPCG